MKILIADDQSRVRFALRVLLEQQESWTVVGEAARVDDLLERVQASRPDLILIDAELPGKPLWEEIQAIRYICPGLRVVFLSETPELIPDNLAARADELASKADPPDQLLAVIQKCGERR